MLPVQKSIVVLLLLIAPALTASNLDSLHALLQSEQQQSNLKKEIALLIQIGETHADQNEMDEALSIFEKALPKAKKIEDWEKYQTLLKYKAEVYLEINQVPLAIETLKNLIDNIKSKEKGNLANAYSELAETYRRIGYNELAYEYHLSGLRLYEEDKDTISIARSLYNIGSIFFYQDNYELGLGVLPKNTGYMQGSKIGAPHIFLP